ncbi:diaminopimelate epimerase [candidate division KSB1 bacterium]|nr:diaminopimelate epimerase [candidate division KSB1 bacterium]
MKQGRKFVKISATGNDFILFDNRQTIDRGDESEFYRSICRRRVSVGADGVLLLERSTEHHFSMRYFNADGSIGEMCGNGARAAAHYAYTNNIAPATMSFDVLGVVYHAKIVENGIELSMPPPVSYHLTPGVAEESALREGAYFDVGVPHYVVFVDHVDAIDVIGLGRKYRYHDSFKPRGVNVNFVEIVDKTHLKIRTYERGVEDETLACGTGTISTVMTAYLQNLVQVPACVDTRGGHLMVDFGADFKDLTLSGMARIIYSGELIDPEI